MVKEGFRLLVTVLEYGWATLSGADSWAVIQIWGQSKLDWLRRYLPLEFEAGFVRWMRGSARHRPMKWWRSTARAYAGRAARISVAST